MNPAALATLALGARATPAALYDWLPLQDDYLRSQSRYRLLRTGNQVVGKTTVGCHDLSLHAMGLHPYRSAGRVGPGEYWLVCASWAQSVAIQTKLFQMLPTSRLHPTTRFDAVRGFVGQNPAVRVLHEQGGYSVIRIKTTNQGGLSLASATIDGCVVDEPPKSQRIYTELMSRVERRGWLSILMTPVNAPTDYLREVVDQDHTPWVDLHRPLTPAELVPVGGRSPLIDGLGQPMDADWIKARSAKVPAHEVGIVVHGEWELRATDRYFSAWNMQTGGPLPEMDLWTSLGVDHGSKPGKQCYVLVGVVDLGPCEMPHVYVLEEYVDPTGRAVPLQDARSLLDMLARQGWSWQDLDDACGDRALMYGRGGEKSNRQLAVAVNRLLGRRGQLRPRLRTIKKGHERGAGSALRRSRYLHWLTAQSRLTVAPHCTAVLEALASWDGSSRHAAKDIIDALMYSLDRWCFDKIRRPSVRLEVGR